MSGKLLVAILALSACGDAGTEPRAGHEFSAITAGYLHTCALDRNGAAYCWGNNDAGTLGDGTRTARSIPARVSGSNVFTQLAAGAAHNCALASGGTAYCWGHNDEGQLGDGTSVDRLVPTAVTSYAFTHISAGHAHTCAVTGNGTGYCWGDGSRGQLGIGEEGATRTNRPVAVLAATPWQRVYAGYYQSCGLTTVGDAYCWGGGESGQNGDSTQATSYVPVRVRTSRRFQSLALGDRFVCGVSSGEVWCWGANRSGELGRPADAGSTVPVRVGSISGAIAGSASMGVSTIGASAEPYACAVLADERALCWGGAVPPFRAAGALPAVLASDVRVTQAAAGAIHVCVLDDARRAWCAGANGSGQLGDGTNTNRSVLTPVLE
jgi:alpha-tubulin suppressor-like RCC1 family protein